MENENNEANGNEAEANTANTQAEGGASNEAQQAPETAAAETVTEGASEGSAASSEAPAAIEAPTGDGTGAGETTTTQAASESEQAATVTEAAAVAETAAAPVNKVKVTFVGAAAATVEVDSGSTVAQAVKAAGVNGNLMLRDNNNGVLSKTAKITNDITITTVAPARGG